MAQLAPVYLDPDRAKRERASRLAWQRRKADREALDALWIKLMALRKQMAANAGFADYRAYRWQEMHRYDYTPDDCATFHAAIEQVAVPAAMRILERRRQRLGLAALRPWDTSVDPLNRPALRPFEQVEDLESKGETIFRRVDPELGEQFHIMRAEGLLDLGNRKGKAPGGYCTMFAATKRPFIFMNAVGMHQDVETLLHEAGHAFHGFATAHLPYSQQKFPGYEFAEVASMSMELLAAPYLTEAEGGFYTPQEAARARIENLEGSILFLPYMAVVDAFQHWVYTNHEAAADPANCDAKWLELWARFMKGVDYSDLDDFVLDRRRHQLHISLEPFYYVDYGVAQLGAWQVWRNALVDQVAALRQYRGALALGDTRSLPELYGAAGAKFAFDARTLREVVDLAEHTIEQLERV